MMTVKELRDILDTLEGERVVRIFSRKFNKTFDFAPENVYKANNTLVRIDVE